MEKPLDVHLCSAECQPTVRPLARVTHPCDVKVCGITILMRENKSTPLCLRSLLESCNISFNDDNDGDPIINLVANQYDQFQTNDIVVCFEVPDSSTKNE